MHPKKIFRDLYPSSPFFFSLFSQATSQFTPPNTSCHFPDTSIDFLSKLASDSYSQHSSIV
ncbi:uncharacterized protein Bfra_011325 [Botrytis fragariae]|uniref:Uncharacterized protein n=1 Tax=Botrytis fragariae TaxID=1964551 RepID=A0A8H6AKY7_9HELO|nr:uncharacterized protein Bfra_011325 [Botrytis fragariae]KAF5869516.1 hypothetical protein Bfra_011325 [Botrytis fragariae]